MTGRWGVLRIVLAAVESIAAVGVAIFVLAEPLTDQLRPGLIVLLGIGIVFAVMQPGSAGAMVLLLSLSIGYLVVTALGDAFGGALPPLPEILLISVALYLIHAIDTLRASVPTDAAVDGLVIIRWLMRLAEVLVPSILLGTVILAEPTRGANGLWYLGALALLAAVAIPSIRMRRKPWLDEGALDDIAKMTSTDDS